MENGAWCLIWICQQYCRINHSQNNLWRAANMKPIVPRKHERTTAFFPIVNFLETHTCPEWNYNPRYPRPESIIVGHESSSISHSIELPFWQLLKEFYEFVRYKAAYKVFCCIFQSYVTALQNWRLWWLILCHSNLFACFLQQLPRRLAVPPLHLLVAVVANVLEMVVYFLPVAILRLDEGGEVNVKLLSGTKFILSDQEVENELIISADKEWPVIF